MLLTTTPPPSDDALPPGTRLHELEIVRVLGVGGFGIVYLARDHSLERDVALKEYMPASLALRGGEGQITVRSSSFAETYAIGLRSFVNEARLLARFDHPSLVKVYRFWEDKGTAYMVMPYLPGRSLREVRRAMAVPPDETWLRGVLDPVLAAVELLHREGVFHRDIAPDNIIVGPAGLPVLLDFGAARRAIGDRTQTFTAILKPSYAPIEQYAEMSNLRQGPWTDLYALGAVTHFLIFGAPPSPATARAVMDDLVELSGREPPGVSPRFMALLAWMLAVRPNERPQDVATVRAALDGRVEPPMAVLRAVPGDEPTMIVSKPPGYAKTQVMQRPAAARPQTTMPPMDGAPTALPVVPFERAKRTPWIAIAAGVIAAVAIAGGWWASRPEAPPTTAATPRPVDAAASVVAVPAPAAAVSLEPKVVTIEAPAPAPAPATATAASAPSTAVVPVAATPRPVTAAPRERPVAEPVSPPAAPASPSDAPAVVETAKAPPQVPAETVTAAPPRRQTVRDVCDRRVLIALQRCLERECRKPSNRNDADCLWHFEERRRRANPDP